MESSEELFSILRELVENWCDRRCLVALRYMLQGYPLHNELTDGWAELLSALENVRAFAQHETTSAEKDTLNRMISTVSPIVYRN
jgi:hypothetical protein